MRAIVALTAVFAAAVLAAPALAGQAKGAKAPAISAGNGTLYIGTYKGEIEVYDEATEKLDRDDQAQDRHPALDHAVARPHALLRPRLAPGADRDHRHRHAQDASTRFTLTTGNKNVRVLNLQPDPDNKFLIMMYRAATKLIDRWEIGPPTLQKYDLTTHQFGQVIPWPRGDERETINMRSRTRRQTDVHLRRRGDVLETQNFTEVETWPLRPVQRTGLGRINLGPVHDFNDPPGTFTGLFTMNDPVQPAASWASAAST